MNKLTFWRRIIFTLVLLLTGEAAAVKQGDSVADALKAELAKMKDDLENNRVFGKKAPSVTK